MSFLAMLQHRVDIQRPTTGEVDGLDTFEWNTVVSNEPCRLDLQFIRSGRDPQWTPEAGRPADRFGVAFFRNGANVKAGDRLVVKKGPAGTFLCEGAVDEALGFAGQPHHMEVGVKEVPGPRARAS